MDQQVLEMRAIDGQNWETIPAVAAFFSGLCYPRPSLAAAAEEASAAMEEMSANIRQSADNAAQTEKIAVQASKEAAESGEATAECDRPAAPENWRLRCTGSRGPAPPRWSRTRPRG